MKRFTDRVTLEVARKKLS